MKADDMHKNHNVVDKQAFGEVNCEQKNITEICLFHKLKIFIQSQC
jgi:hypothetical protein